MASTLYHHVCPTPRLLSREEIAGLCNVSPARVQAWIDAHLLGRSAGDGRYVEAMNVVRFMLENRLQVPARLLPPGTRKILFVASEGSSPTLADLWAKRIAGILKVRRSILLETITAGGKPELAIMTSRPDLVVFLLSSYNRLLASVLEMIAGDPAGKILHIVSAEVKMAIEQGDIELHGDLILADDLDEARATALIGAIFDR